MKRPEMQTLSALALLSFCFGLGTLAHHMGETGGTVPRDSGRVIVRRAETTGAAPARGGAGTLAEDLRGMTHADSVDWAELYEKLSAVPVEEFPALWAAVSEEHGYAGSVELGVLECWAAADAEGLLRAAEKGGHGLKLEYAVGKCMKKHPSLVLAVLQRAAAAPGATEKRQGALWRYALGDELRVRPAETLRVMVDAGAVKYFQRDGGPPGMLEEALEKWAGTDAPAMMRLAAGRPDLQSLALDAWLGHNPDAALAWVAEHVPRPKPPPPEYADDPFLERPNDAWMAAGLMRYATSHPLEAERFYDRVVHEMEEFNAEAKLGFRVSQAEGMAWRPAEETAAWLRTLSGKDREVAGSAILNRIMRADPALAAALCVAAPEAAVPRELEKTAFAEYGKFHPVEAVAALAPGTVPEDLRARCLPGVVDSWLVLDRAAALRFIDREPVSELKGELILRASGILEESGVDAARDFALTLPDPVMRLGACRSVLEERFQIFQKEEDAAAVDEWIAALPDAGVRAALAKTAAESRKAAVEQ